VRPPAPYRARPARSDDLDELVELFQARDRADVGFADPARDELVMDWHLTGFDLERDTVVAETPDGTITAYGSLLVLDPAAQQFALGRVHPDHSGRGLGGWLVGELERRAALRLGHGASGPMRVPVPETDQPAVELLTAREFRHVRSFWHMERPLDDLPSLAVPEGFTLRLGATDGDEVTAHALIDEAFRENFGYESIDLDDWLAEVRAAPGYDRALLVFAMHGATPAGVAMNFTSDDGIGWVGELGVLAPFRGNGVGSALLHRSFSELVDRGMREVRLGVDAENTSGATHLYRKAGMTVRRRYDTYEKTVVGA
jgi:mycothiol synthase